MKTDLMKH